MKNKHPSSIDLKEINLISKFLQLIKKDKKSRVKSNKPMFT